MTANMKSIKLILTSASIACITLLVNCGGTVSSGPSENTASIDFAGGSAMRDNDNEIETGSLGLTVKRVYVVDASDKRISGSYVQLNSTFSIVFEGIRNFTLKKGKASPALSLLVIDDNQNTVINKTDLLTMQAGGISEEDASRLRATIETSGPIKAGKYICSIQVTDKNNTDAAIASTWSFEVK